MYAIRETNGTEWWRGDRFTPASDEARLFDSADEAEEEADEKCAARTVQVVEIDAE